MKPDIEKYRRYADAFDLTEEQKVELIETVWHLVEAFTDRAFGHDSYALLVAEGGKIAGDAGKLIDLERSQLASAFDAAYHGEAGKP